ncbi:MAG: hypothetical protein ACTHN0_19950, partial [Aquihabitans sp.]
LDADDERRLDALAAVHGDRSRAVREAIRALAEQQERSRGLRALLDDIEAEDGPVDEAGVEEYIRRYDL